MYDKLARLSGVDHIKKVKGTHFDHDGHATRDPVDAEEKARLKRLAGH